MADYIIPDDCCYIKQVGMVRKLRSSGFEFDNADRSGYYGVDADEVDATR